MTQPQPQPHDCPFPLPDAHDPIVAQEDIALLQRGICPLCLHDLALETPTEPTKAACIECEHEFTLDLNLIRYEVTALT